MTHPSNVRDRIYKGASMTNNLPKPSQFRNPDTFSTQRPNRRTFLITATSAVGVAGVVALRPSLAFAAAAGAGAPGTVTVIQFSDAGKPTGKVSVPRVVRADAEWKQKLVPISFEVARRFGTERPYTGSTWNNHDHGFYRCICCDNAVFSSETKFESGTGWPSFWQPIAKENIVEIRDMSLGMERTAISCRECDAHLGHVFDDGPRPTGLHYCMNSAAMRFVKTA
jgi:peptide-methionine (R)-S-oxide reductase